MMRKELQEALTTVRARLTEQEKVARPLFQLTEALALAISVEEQLENAPRQLEVLRAERDRVIADCEADKAKAQADLRTAKQELADLLEQAREEERRIEQTRKESERLAGERVEERRQQHAAEEAQAEARLSELKAEERALRQTVAELAAIREKYKSELERSLQAVGA